MAACCHSQGPETPPPTSHITSAKAAIGSPKYVTGPAATSRHSSTSPGRSSQTLNTHRMSPQYSSLNPVARPQSPLSPHYDPHTRFEQLRPPSPRGTNPRNGNTQRKANTNTLKLSSLPRFHPSNFPSARNSAQHTPVASAGSPQPPTSPRTHQRVLSGAQRHLLHYQHDRVSSARSATPTSFHDPISPRLSAVESPGPVTPLELEADDNYLSAGARYGAVEASPSAELVEQLFGEQSSQRRRPSGSPSRSLAR